MTEYKNNRLEWTRRKISLEGRTIEENTHQRKNKTSTFISYESHDFYFIRYNINKTSACAVQHDRTFYFSNISLLHISLNQKHIHLKQADEGNYFPFFLNYIIICNEILECSMHELININPT